MKADLFDICVAAGIVMLCVGLAARGLGC
jgi:hypothetical protein